MKPLFCLLLLALPALAQQFPREQPADQQPQGRQRLSDTARAQPLTNAPVAATVDETPAVTHHEISIGGKTVKSHTKLKRDITEFIHQAIPQP